uniref:Ragulator complex protein LAMTOR1 n=2 Tax=Ficedula albicollis TaxID=59894 RepID=A0A803V3B7_FICAL
MQLDAGCRLLPAGLATPNVLPDFSHACCLCGWEGFSWEKAKELGKEVPGRAEAVLDYTGMHREPSWLEEETKRLLEPAASPPNKVLNGAEQSYHNLPSARTDEQAMLSSILAKTAINIIDVSAADSQGMEQHEYMDRARQYSTRLAMLSNNLTHWKKLPLLPSLTNQPHQVLASDPVPFADLQQVSRIAAYAFSALSQIRVDAKEELVVQFGIP